MASVRDQFTLTYIIAFISCFAGEKFIREDKIIVNSTLKQMLDIFAGNSSNQVVKAQVKPEEKVKDGEIA